MPGLNRPKRPWSLAAKEVTSRSRGFAGCRQTHRVGQERTLVCDLHAHSPGPPLPMRVGEQPGSLVSPTATSRRAGSMETRARTALPSRRHGGSATSMAPMTGSCFLAEAGWGKGRPHARRTALSIRDPGAKRPGK
jgi:hypothetical protein